MSRYANWKARQTPKSHTRRARNWRTIVFGERITNKHGRLTDWEVVSPPYKKDPWDVLTRIDVLCLACGQIYDRYLGDIIQGNSRRCGSCRSAGRKAPQAVYRGLPGASRKCCGERDELRMPKKRTP
jgi:hypothetical protein